MNFKSGDRVECIEGNSEITKGCIGIVDKFDGSYVYLKGKTSFFVPERFKLIGHEDDAITIPKQFELKITYNGLMIVLDARRAGTCSIAMAAIEGIVQEIASADLSNCSKAITL